VSSREQVQAARDHLEQTVKTERTPKVRELKQVADVQGERYVIDFHGNEQVVPGLKAKPNEGDGFWVKPR
jgi:hypothetical protein